MKGASKLAAWKRQRGWDRWALPGIATSGAVCCLLRPLGAGTLQDAAGQRGGCVPFGPGRPVSALQVLGLGLHRAVQPGGDIESDQTSQGQGPTLCPVKQRPSVGPREGRVEAAA